jgi:hypothetical protein
MSEQNDAVEITELTSKILEMEKSNPEAYNEFIGEVKQLQAFYIQMALYGIQDFEGGFKPTKNSYSSRSMTDKEINPSPEGADLNLQRFKPTRKRNKTKRRRSVPRH